MTKLNSAIQPDWVGKKYRLDFHDPYALAKSYSNRLEAKWAEVGGSVVNLELNGALPDKEIAFINQFIVRYQQYDVDKKNLVASKSIEFLDRQLSNIKDSLRYFDRRMRAFKEDRFTTNIESEASRIYQRIEQLEAQQAQLTLLENYYKYLETYIKTSNNYDQVVPPSAVGVSDPVIVGLITNLTELQSSIRLLGDQQNDDNPLVANKRQAIQQMKGDILEGLKSVRASHKINYDFISSQIKEAEKGLVGLPQSEREILDLKRDYALRENLYIFLTQSEPRLAFHGLPPRVILLW